jgi:hypothetical protein
VHPHGGEVRRVGGVHQQQLAPRAAYLGKILKWLANPVIIGRGHQQRGGFRVRVERGLHVGNHQRGGDAERFNDRRRDKMWGDIEQRQRGADRLVAVAVNQQRTAGRYGSGKHGEHTLCRAAG